MVAHLRRLSVLVLFGVACAGQVTDGGSGDPLVVGDPVASGDRSTGDPVFGDGVAGDPASGDPVPGDPIAGDPVPGDATPGDAPASAGNPRALQIALTSEPASSP